MSEDKLFYYSKSADKYPGKGVNEYTKENIYKELSTIKNWRKMLSNFYIAPFKLDGYTWNSVEHYYHANKFLHNIDLYKSFTLESKSSYSEDPVKAKSAGGKSG